MGVFIYLNVSNKVKPEEWEKAYEESLILVDKLNLVEWSEIKKFNHRIRCLTLTKERKIDGRVGWLTHGDGIFLGTAEGHFLPRKISAPETSEEYADPLMYVLAQNGVTDFENPYIRNIHEFFGSKTQGEPYHTVLLAVGCLLDDRLDGEAICCGDITYGQCNHAIEVANKFLERPIKMPLRCDLNRLYERVRKLPIEKEKFLQAFEATYLGPKNKEYFEFVDKNFTDEEKCSFVRECLKGKWLGTYGFSRSIQQMLAYPIPISKICKEFVALQPETMVDKDSARNPYEMFVNHILETNIFVQEKDLRNCLDVDEASGETMCIEKQFASIFMLGMRNKNVDRYVPLDELKRQLVSVIGEKCDVEKIVNEFVEKQTSKEKDYIKLLNDFHDEFNKAEAELDEKYDVAKSSDLPFYQKGNSVNPKLLESVKSSIDFYRTLTDEPEYTEILNKGIEEKFEYFAVQNRCLRLLKESWEKILKDIEDNPASFERYYPMVRVKISSDDAQDIVRAYVENDEFYEFCQTL